MKKKHKVVKSTTTDNRTVIILPELQNMLKGEDVIVCGLAPSLLQLKEPNKYWTIGVNDIGRIFTPDFLVVLNSKSTFRGDRWGYIQSANPKYFVSCYNFQDIKHTWYVHFRLGKFGKIDFSDPMILNHSQNSPYVGINLAVLLGAKKIGLIGVDFTENHCFVKSGVHSLNKRLPLINEQYGKLAKACMERKEIEVVNLSDNSNITSLNRGKIEDIRPK